MTDIINDIILRLHRRGVDYIRLYHTDSFSANKRRKLYGHTNLPDEWVCKALRNRNGQTTVITTQSQGNPIDAFKALEKAVDDEANAYLSRIEQEIASDGQDS